MNFFESNGYLLTALKRLASLTARCRGKHLTNGQHRRTKNVVQNVSKKLNMQTKQTNAICHPARK